MKKAILAALAATLAAPAVFAAPAANPFAQDQAVLNLRAIDLATVEGQRVLAVRMDQAARSVCGDRLTSVHLSLDAQSRACRNEVVAGIRAQIEQRTAAADTASKGKVELALR